MIILLSGEHREANNGNYNIIENIIVDSCVLWNDWGRALEIGASIVADTIKNVSFSKLLYSSFYDSCNGYTKL